jgi:hypothetical protein
MFCAPELVFGHTEGVGFDFHILCSRDHFRQYQGNRVHFSYFVRFSSSAFPDSFSVMMRARGPLFMFHSPRLIFNGAEGAECFLSSALLDSFSMVQKSSSLIFEFRAPGIIFGGTLGVGSSFRVILSQTRFRQMDGAGDQFSSSTLYDPFSMVSRPSSPVFKYSAIRLVFSTTEGASSSFEFRVPRLIFALPNSFSVVPRARSVVFEFCALGLVSGNVKGVGSGFLFSHTRNNFGRFKGVGSNF